MLARGKDEMKGLAVFSSLTVALSAWLYFVLTLGFGVRPFFATLALAAASLVASVQDFYPLTLTVLVVSVFVIAVNAGVVWASVVAPLVVFGLPAAASALADEVGSKFRWAFSLIVIEASSIFGALVIGGLVGIGIAAVGVGLLACLYFLPERFYLRQEGTAKVASLR